MPIKLDKYSAPRLPRLGKVKLGVMVQSPGKKPHPRATSYLVVPAAVQKVHGEKPSELPIMFHADRIEDVYIEDLKAYKTSGLWCLGDAQVAKRWGDDGKLHEVTCPCAMLDRGECKAEGRLVFLLPEVVGLGVWELRSGSPRALREFKTALGMYAAAFGGLRGIPFRLTLEAEETQRPQEGGRGMAKTTIYVPHIRSDHSLMDVRRFRMGLGAAVEPLMLEAGLPGEPDDHPEADAPGEGADEVTAAPAARSGMSPVDIGPVAVSAEGGLHRAVSQPADPSPPEAVLVRAGTDPDSGVALFLDEVLELAQSVEVDRKTAEAYLEATRPEGDSWAEYLSDRIDWIREARQTPAGAAAVKAAMVAGARGQARLV